MTKVKSKRKVIQESPKEQRTVHVATMMDICLLKLEPTFHKYKGRAVFRGEIVKDDSGSCAVPFRQ